MVRKLLYIIISAGILVFGYLAVTRLSYWERSVRIFKTGSTENYGGRMGRGGFGERGEFRRPDSERPDFRQIPDSLRQRSAGRGGRQFTGEIPDSIRQRIAAGRGRFDRTSGNVPDSIRQEFRDGGERGRFRSQGAEEGFRGHGRGGDRGGKDLNLRNVWWFTAVFASFTVIALWCDKLYCYVRRRKVKV